MHKFSWLLGNWHLVVEFWTKCLTYIFSSGEFNSLVSISVSVPILVSIPESGSTSVSIPDLGSLKMSFFEINRFRYFSFYQTLKNYKITIPGKSFIASLAKKVCWEGMKKNWKNFQWDLPRVWEHPSEVHSEYILLEIHDWRA